MWLALEDKQGNDTFIQTDDIKEIYVNIEYSWLCITTTRREIVITSQELSSSDILNTPTVINVNSTESIERAFEKLSEVLGFDAENCRRITL